MQNGIQQKILRNSKFINISVRACMLSRFSHFQLFATLWTIASQAPLSIGFSRQEYWSGLPCTAPGDLPNPGIEPTSLSSPELISGFFTTSDAWDASVSKYLPIKYLITKQEIMEQSNRHHPHLVIQVTSLIMRDTEIYTTQLAWAATTDYHRLSDLNNRN